VEDTVVVGVGVAALWTICSGSWRLIGVMCHSRLPLRSSAIRILEDQAGCGMGMSDRLGYPVRLARSSGLPSQHSAVLGWQGRDEEVSEQLGDALSLIVMDPVRRVGQALDAVQAGHVVVVGLG